MIFTDSLISSVFILVCNLILAPTFKMVSSFPGFCLHLTYQLLQWERQVAGPMGVGGLLSAGDNYMLWKGQPQLVLGNRGELLSAFWKAGAMLERGWREPLMGLAEKQLLIRRISVNFEVSHARISTIAVTSKMSRAEMTYLVRK